MVPAEFTVVATHMVEMTVDTLRFDTLIGTANSAWVVVNLARYVSTFSTPAV